VARIALIGDLHGSWDDTDVRAFNASDHDMMLFAGDLGSGTARNSVEIARSISGLTKRAIVMPGNNDADFLPEIAAEFGRQRGIAELIQLGARQTHAGIGRCPASTRRPGEYADAPDPRAQRPARVGQSRP
jgi:predicted phosphodiesterase